MKKWFGILLVGVLMFIGGCGDRISSTLTPPPVDPLEMVTVSKENGIFIKLPSGFKEIRRDVMPKNDGFIALYSSPGSQIVYTVGLNQPIKPTSVYVLDQMSKEKEHSYLQKKTAQMKEKKLVGTLETRPLTSGHKGIFHEMKNAQGDSVYILAALRGSASITVTVTKNGDFTEAEVKEVREVFKSLEF